MLQENRLLAPPMAVVVMTFISNHKRFCAAPAALLMCYKAGGGLG